MVKYVLKWNSSPLIKPKNMIVSSDAVLNNIKGFTPSYEKEHLHMQCLLSNAYMRRWFDERTVHEKKYYYNPEKLVKKKFSPYRKTPAKK